MNERRDDGPALDVAEVVGVGDGDVCCSIGVMRTASCNTQLGHSKERTEREEGERRTKRGGDGSKDERRRGCEGRSARDRDHQATTELTTIGEESSFSDSRMRLAVYEATYKSVGAIGTQ